MLSIVRSKTAMAAATLVATGVMAVVGVSAAGADSSTTAASAKSSTVAGYGCHDGPGGTYRGTFNSCVACQGMGEYAIRQGWTRDYICVPVTGTRDWSLGYN